MTNPATRPPFDPPLMYGPPAGRFAGELAAAWLPLLAALAMRRAAPEVTAWLVPVLLGLAAILTVAVAVFRGPARARVRLDSRGIAARGVARRWSEVREVTRHGPANRKQSELEAIEIRFEIGPAVRIRRDWTAGAGIASLRNLADAIEDLAAAAREEDLARRRTQAVPDEAKGI